MSGLYAWIHSAVNRVFSPALKRASRSCSRFEYRFRWKHRLLFDIANIHNSRTVLLNRMIEFQEQFYLVGAPGRGSLLFSGVRSAGPLSGDGWTELLRRLGSGVVP